MYARFSPVSLSGLVETAADTFTATALGVGGATSTAYPLNVTGSGHISGSLTVDGSMNVSGTTTTTNTAVVVSEQMNITNTGTGPALQVTQQGAQPVATFVDGEGAMAMKIWDNGLISLNSSVQPANQLEISGNVKILGTGSFIGNLSGNATTASSATTAAACTGNAATATTAAACTGNAATATTAAACTGNAATATIADSCSGNAATATTAAQCTGNASSATTADSCSGNSLTATTATTAAACTGNAATATTAAACTGNAATVTTLTSTQVAAALPTPLILTSTTLTNANAVKFNNGANVFTLQQIDNGGLNTFNMGRSGYNDLVINGTNANSTGGFVGIGTASPNAPLHVTGSTLVGGNMTIGDVSMDVAKLYVVAPNGFVTIDGLATTTYLQIQNTVSDATLTMLATSGNFVIRNRISPIQLTTSTNTGLVIDASGNVGIGTSTPGVALDVVGTVRATTFSGTATTALACTGNAASATTAAACTGNAASATTAAACTGNAATATTALACTGNAATATKVQWSGIQNWPVNTNKYWSADTNNLWITSGNVGIGTSTPGVALDVNGVIRGSIYGYEAYFSMSGGGVVQFDGTYLNWSQRVICIPQPGLMFLQIDCPTSGTITYYANGTSTPTTAVCTTNGIPINQNYWPALYYNIRGLTTTASDPTRFILVDYTTTYQWVPTSDWILIANVEADTGIFGVKWHPGGKVYIPNNGIYLSSTGRANQQSGTLTVASATYYTGQATATLTFPTAFLTTPNVTGTLSFSVTGVWQLFLGIQSISTTGVVFTLNNSGGTASPATIVYINWIATV